MVGHCMGNEVLYQKPVRRYIEDGSACARAHPGLLEGWSGSRPLMAHPLSLPAGNGGGLGRPMWR